MLTRTFCVFFVLVAAWSSRAGAEPATTYDRDPIGEGEPDHKMAILLNPLDVALGVYGGEVDFVLGDHVAVGVEGAFYNFSGATATAMGVGLIMYPLSGALHGWYVDPRVAYARPLDEGPFHFDWQNDVVGFGVTSGWQWTWDYGFSVRVGGGAMYYHGGGGFDPQSAPVRGPQLVLDGSIGWAF
jgi:hypothetical protein